MPKPTFFNLPEDKRQRVICAAVHEFATHPFRVASLDRIAKASGVSKGSLYQYFEDKAELYRWLLGQWLPQRKAQAMSGALSSGAGLFDTLEASFFAGLRLFVEEPALGRLGAILLDAVPEPEIADLHASSREGSHQALVAMVRGAQASGEVRPELDPELVAVLIATMMGHGLLEALARRVGVSSSELARDIEAVQRLDEDELGSLVSEFGGMLRAAIG